MPKRKGRAECESNGSAYPISHFDAAMDLLVSETYNRIFTLAKMYEKAGGLQLDQTQCLGRWHEAVRRWECVQSLSGLSWDADSKGKGKEVGGVEGVELEWASSTSRDGRGKEWEWNSLVLGHAGVAVTKELNSSEEAEWRRWIPQVGDIVLVDMADGSTWPGKVIDRKNFFKSRTIPRGNHFFPVRIYAKDQPPICTIKSRLVPFNLRPRPPNNAVVPLLEAYSVASNPHRRQQFDSEADERETECAAKRMYCSREEKDAWNKQVNWVMNERRHEKLRTLSEERARKIKEEQLSQKRLDEGRTESNQVFGDGDGDGDGDDGDDMDEDGGGGKRRRSYLQKEVLNGKPERGGLFKLTPLPGPDSPMLMSRNDPSLRKQSASSSNSMASFIRPALSDPKNVKRSPRRPQALRRSTLISAAGNSPTAPSAPSLPQFEFVSPLGPKSLGKLAFGRSTPPPLPSVVEAEEDGEWTKVESKAKLKARGASEPCVSFTEMADGMDQDEEL